ncbi:MAG: hypothetical protein CVU41_16175 [Chloroflexi bacterium HGW-Chloroflexi-3]|nr:MAG: hypothetical protein CVU41_16175 [Chloroflexi bacterium HGW-Chloroflexi-3]
MANGLSDYHFPNNHVFHTFLVHLTYKLFGPYEWAVRMPAFIASLLLAPFGFIFAKRWYGDRNHDHRGHPEYQRTQIPSPILNAIRSTLLLEASGL